MKDYCVSHYPTAKNDLANVFLERCLELSQNGGSGVVQIVMPQNWLFLSSYKKQRESLLKRVQWNLLARLGPGAFETITGEVVQAVLLTQTCTPMAEGYQMRGVDAGAPRTAQEKARLLREGAIRSVSQKAQLANPDYRISLEAGSSIPLLLERAVSYQGICTGDSPRFNKLFWEITIPSDGWVYQATSVLETCEFSGREMVFYWQEGEGEYREYLYERLGENGHSAWVRGLEGWGKNGVLVTQMKELSATLYSGTSFDNNAAIIIPKDLSDLPAIWAFVSSPKFNIEVRKVDQKLNVTGGTLVKVPFDKEYWNNVASEQYPKGLPKAYSDDPTQWIFHGHPQPSTNPLQVAVARLAGYTWPAESDDKMELSDVARQWVARSKTLASHADKDGIVCIPPVGREASASDRLLNLLADAYGTDWSNDVLAQLLTAADHSGKSLETWLRDKFFIQHCALFGNRPFVWHIWDGLRDGFAALVNYHKLDYKTLEALIYTYLGDWISRQKRDSDNGVDGAQEKLAAAEGLKKRLEQILAGEEPYDIFVRWKPIEEQPIGWNPDLNDGVRLNIRPFLSVPDVGKRGAGVLRDKPKSLHWEKDRGSDVPSAPWYELGLQYGGKVGDRINDHHLSLAEKRAAREKAK